MSTLKSRITKIFGYELFGSPRILLLYTTLIVLCAGIIGYSFGRQSIPTSYLPPEDIYGTPNPISPTPLPIPDQEPLTDWLTFDSKEYSFKYPPQSKQPETTLSKNESTVKLSYMGQKQIDSGRTQTELWDGYIFTIRRTSLSTNTTPQKHVETLRENTINDCPTDSKTVSEIRQVTLNNISGMEYSAQCMSDFTITVIQNDNLIYEITQLYMGEEPELSNYKQITSNILKSLTFK